MLQHPVHRHVRRFICSVVLFGGIIVVLVYLPVNIIRIIYPSVLPYRIALNIDTPFSELSLELLLLQVVLPALLEQSQARHALKQFALFWCRCIGRVLGLQEYLLPANEITGAAPSQNAATQSPMAADAEEQVTEAGSIPADHDSKPAEGFEEEQDLNDQQPSTSTVYRPAGLSKNDISSTNLLPSYPDEGAEQPQTRHPESSFSKDRDPSVAREDSSVARRDVSETRRDDAPVVVDAPQAPAVPAQPQHNNNLAEEHQALLLEHWPTGNQPYRKPTFFTLRVILLLIVIALSLLVASLACLTIPVTLGRAAIKVMTGRRASTPHELYTLACGLYISWLAMRAGVMVSDWMATRYPLRSTVVYWATIVAKTLGVAVGLVGVIPLLTGTLFQVIVVTPMRVNVAQSPIAFPVQDWAMGILHCKIGCALIMMGGDWHLKQVFERIYQDGFRNINVTYVYTQLVIPVVTVLGLVLTIPYVVAHSILPRYGYSVEDEILFQRHVYPCLLVVAALVVIVGWNVRQLNRVLLHIRNERYLVGQRLVNFDRSFMATAAIADQPAETEN